ncbi:hypothetical protein SISNIDRAFT_484722 [Sistotremastrum niveocremeum HHB9708]|uniref:Flavin reductase like domain-containing protein n=1 Tax=Sistotremastrum niveocremeum HHB9708 TaxID=1314777 RepID=A0A164VVH9_9AGAM|nr:hypothetical protein SISNIDRAFT_484722 [Sistotremastrum niveocremeum HHB9708]
MNISRLRLTGACSRAYSSNFSSRAEHHNLLERLAGLLRETAQPVAVVTTHASANSNDQDVAHPYHGATLSSFTSISFHPYPVIAFSLRVPSRMATLLRSAKDHAFAMNILSDSQESVALAFSRPDLFPRPFIGCPYKTNEDGLPVINGVLGSLSCRTLISLPLHNLERPDDKTLAQTQSAEPPKGSSELFLAKVLRVDINETEKSHLPLVYHRRKYVTVDLTPGKPNARHG